ncbi:hypothetical protein L7F22_008622 [Adiantum nelumboides]|nr:hypothetical protein [Adiantum nelumboides]
MAGGYPLGQRRQPLPLLPAQRPVPDVAVLRRELHGGAGDLDRVAVERGVVVGLGVLDRQVHAAVGDVRGPLRGGRHRVGVDELAVVAHPHGPLLHHVVAVLRAHHPLVGELLGDDVDARAGVAVRVVGQAVGRRVVRDLLAVADHDHPERSGVGLDDLGAADRERRGQVLGAVAAAAVVDALERRVHGDLRARRPVLLRPPVHARAAVLVRQPAPRALDLRRGRDLQDLLDRGAVLDVPVELDLDRRGDADGAVVADVQGAAHGVGGFQRRDGALHGGRRAVRGDGAPVPGVGGREVQVTAAGPGGVVRGQRAVDGVAVRVGQRHPVQRAARRADRDRLCRVRRRRRGGRLVAHLWSGRGRGGLRHRRVLR